jgi:DNA-binding transcriptional MocR family regulator
MISIQSIQYLNLYGVNWKIVMVTITPDALKDRTGPRYLAIADLIEGEIESGVLAPGSRLPTQRALAYHLGVTVGTVSRAYRTLARRRLVGGEVGRGTYVREKRPATAPMRLSEGGNLLDLTKNAPAAGPQGAALSEALQTILESERQEILLDYAPASGRGSHRRAGADWMRRVGLDVTADEVIVTAGAQQALAAALATLAGGRPVLVEALTYPGLLDIGRAMDVALHPVPMDADGLVPDAFERAAEKTGARLAVLVPTLQNPTNTVLSEARRLEIVEISRRHDLTLVEDDVYGYVIEERPNPIAQLAPERTLYISSASKCMAPGLRLAWAVAPPASRDAFLDMLYATSVCRPPLIGEVGRHWIEDGQAARMVAWYRRETAARQALAAAHLDGYPLSAHPASFHVFLELPGAWSSEAYAAAARERGVAVVPATAFAVRPEDAPSAVRISLSYAPDRGSLEAALHSLADLARSPPSPSRGII